MATTEKRGEGDGARYRVKVRMKGEKPRTRTFKRLTDTKGWAKAVETDLGRGQTDIVFEAGQRPLLEVGTFGSFAGSRVRLGIMGTLYSPPQ